MTPMPAPPHATAAALHAAATSAAAGNPAAARVVVEQSWPVVVRYCRARVGPDADALARRICGRVVTAYRPERDSHRPFLGYLYRIAAAEVDAESVTPPDRWLADIDPMSRDVVLLRLLEGLTATDTASAMDLSRSEVLVMQHRAMRRIREHANEFDASAG